MSKRIVICADGTWNRPEKDPRKDHPTNVQRIAQAIQPRAADGIAQQAFYDDGLGWYQAPWFSGFAGNGVQGSIIAPIVMWCRTMSQAMNCFSSASVAVLMSCGRYVV